MNRPHFFRSFLSSQLSGSKPLTSPAKRVAYRDASKSVMGATPERPLRIPFHVSSVPMPSGDTSPMPVTTTRRRGRVGRPSGWLIANSPFDLRDHRVRFVHNRAAPSAHGHDHHAVRPNATVQTSMPPLGGFRPTAVDRPRRERE